MTRLDKVVLTKEQVQKLKNRILSYQEEDRKKERDFYNSEELIELFKGEEVDSKLILREANNILEEEAGEKKDKKDKKENTITFFAWLFGTAILIAGYSALVQQCTGSSVWGYNQYQEENKKYESTKIELAYDNSLVKKLTTE